MDNYSMNDYSLNDITLVDKKYYSELKRKAKAFDAILKIDLAQHDEEYADNVMKVVNKYTEDKND